jgi:hypothetical protein
LKQKINQLTTLHIELGADLLQLDYKLIGYFKGEEEKDNQANTFLSTIESTKTIYNQNRHSGKKVRQLEVHINTLADETLNSPALKVLPAAYGVQISKKQNEIPHPASARTFMSVSNGTGRRNMSARTARYLTESGHDVATIDNAKTFNKRVSTIFFKPGHKQAALLQLDYKLIRFYKGQKIGVGSDEI